MNTDNMKIVNVTLPEPYASEANAHMKTKIKLVEVESRLVNAEMVLESLLWAIDCPDDFKERVGKPLDAYILNIINGYFIANGGAYKDRRFK